MRSKENKIKSIHWKRFLDDTIEYDWTVFFDEQDLNNFLERLKIPQLLLKYYKSQSIYTACATGNKTLMNRLQEVRPQGEIGRFFSTQTQIFHVFQRFLCQWKECKLTKLCWQHAGWQCRWHKIFEWRESSSRLEATPPPHLKTLWKSCRCQDCYWPLFDLGRTSQAYSFRPFQTNKEPHWCWWWDRILDYQHHCQHRTLVDKPVAEFGSAGRKISTLTTKNNITFHHSNLSTIACEIIFPQIFTSQFQF